MTKVCGIKTFADRSLDRLEAEVNNFIADVNKGKLADTYKKVVHVSDVKYQTSMMNNNTEIHNAVVTISCDR